ncbi:MAG: hypothetical protein HN509_07035 [Halobacteriovoraceae bacterium]|jgi:hypothetical protein|nr:hypothetical protein [Halobacteriovoraceae bacterium]
MKYLLTFLVILNSAFASNDVAFNLRWKLVRDNDISIVWKARNVKNIFASISTIKRKSDIKLYKNMAYFKELLAKKNKMLSFSGISDWKVASHKWVKGKSDEVSLTFAGSYKDHRGTQITYTEIHKFSKGKVTQILYTQPNSTKTDPALKVQLFQKYGVSL